MFIHIVPADPYYQIIRFRASCIMDNTINIILCIILCIISALRLLEHYLHICISVYASIQYIYIYRVLRGMTGPAGVSEVQTTEGVTLHFSISQGVKQSFCHHNNSRK